MPGEMSMKFRAHHYENNMDIEEYKTRVQDQEKKHFEEVEKKRINKDLSFILT